MTGGKGYRVTVDKMSKVMADIKAMTKDDVFVGVPGEKASRKDKAKINNATIGYMNEYGSAAANIPARPFLVPGVKEVQAECTAEMAKGLARSFDNPGAMVQHLNRAGGKAMQSVKKHIQQMGNYLPSSPTYKHRLWYSKKKGIQMRSTVLRFTGDFINSIHYVIKAAK